MAPRHPSRQPSEDRNLASPPTDDGGKAAPADTKAPAPITLDGLPPMPPPEEMPTGSGTALPTRAVPDEGTRSEPKCCGTCNAFVMNPPEAQPKDGAAPRHGYCIANPPQLAVSTYESVQVPAALGTRQLLVLRDINSFYPPTNALRSCRDGYEPRELRALSVESPTVGGKH